MGSCLEGRNVEFLGGQLEMWQLMFDFSSSMALKCAIDLGIADIIHSHGGPITLSQIISGIKPSHADHGISSLARVMRLLVLKKVFTYHQTSDGAGEILYGLNEKSKWLLRDSEFSLASMILTDIDSTQLVPWLHIGNSIKEGGIPLEKATGLNFWEFTANVDPQRGRIFNEAMASVTRIVMKTLLSEYKNGFDNINSLVDVGGGNGSALSEIVKAYPHIKGINFDMPHVIATAPTYDGILHVSGDMFKSIPNADAVFIKMVMHNWDDEHCLKLLKNCRKAIPEESGKLILVEMVLREHGNHDTYEEVKVAFDLMMFVHTTGKERPEFDWKKLLGEGGFPRYKIIKISSFVSVIEAYPQQ